MTGKELKQIDAWLDSDLSHEDAADLEAWLRADPAHLEMFARASILHRHLRDLLCAQAMAEKAGESENSRQGLDPGLQPSSLPTSAPVAPVIIAPYSLGHHSPSTSFVDSWPFPYLAATVILGMMLLGFWAYKITHHQHIAGVPSQSVPSDARQEVVFVGRITGMVDVKWSDDPRYLPPPGFAHVPLGRKYKLDAGLMEITYDSGAKVILEGPCTYEVESTAGGYLALGKLTARVEARGEGRGASEGRVANQKSPSSLILHPSSFIPHPSSLFSVRTPTAVVTDLGTEFGVEVSEEGTTESRVFRGSVKVEVVSDEGRGQGVVLRENESARVEGGDEPCITVLGASAKTADFTRRIPKRTIKTLDLVDVVAGGDGFSGRRDRGIDSTNGRIIDALSARSVEGGPSTPMTGDGQYHRMAEMPFIDGVFIPDGGGDAVQVDSAGHVFDWFRDTANTTWQHIWAGGAFRRDQKYSSKVGGVDHALPGHGLVFMHANSAITFDLEAIRRANPGARLLRFRATAANTGVLAGVQFYADVWVLVDGQRRFQRRLRNNDQGLASVLVPIYDGDRFLTLAATDAGDGISMDWIIFGDPRLELSVVDANEQKRKGEQTMNDP